ncbi:MAG TPA: hypothetical protein VG096_23470 [Bryobacteraceae bacterium]|jgi:hypothetical protein|nr:hypothetical protein [Bryobacteraceae bacterium]
MLASVLITAASVILLCYWFRYSCLLLLRNRSERAVPPADERFSFWKVRERLATAPDLDPLRLSLERDYRMVTYLLEHTAGLGTQSLEDRLLQLDYKLMHRWYAITHTAAPQQARRALSEMAAIVACLAQKMSSPAGIQSES